MSDKMRSELGCSMIILFAPLFLLGAIALTDTSSDSDTTYNVEMSYVMFAIAALTFLLGVFLWLRHR